MIAADCAINTRRDIRDMPPYYAIRNVIGGPTLREFVVHSQWAARCAILPETED
jgi:hypothetical protein